MQMTFFLLIFFLFRVPADWFPDVFCDIVEN